GAPQGGWAQAEGKFKYQGDQFRPVDRVVFDEYVHVLENDTIHTLTLPTVFGTRTFEISESELFKVFKEVAGDKGSLLYRVGALGGIKPISLFTYRFKAYEGFIRWLEENNLNITDVILEHLKEKPAGLLEFLNTHPVLEAGWVGNDPKACRMFVNWVVFLFNKIWKAKVAKMEETLMIVDGHVGKVFCRTGLLGEVLYEKRRPYIIQASRMRPRIEEIVSSSGRIPFYVDNGAFYLFEDSYCTELDPRCEGCPIGKICKKNIRNGPLTKCGSNVCSYHFT
ncbi:MAG: hypothetical protein ACTSUQ_12770, partial [Candidatus Freyarchaeota archaeon]